MIDPMAAQRFCTYCGREMIEVKEPSGLYDKQTGEKVIDVWLQCPKFPKNGFQSMFRGCHESNMRGGLISRGYW